MKIGVFGGCFNPPHNMHKTIAQTLLKQGTVDEIIYVPAGNFYEKKGLLSFEDRYTMVKKMIEGESHLWVSKIGNDPSYAYTYQVLDYFKEKTNAEIYFICGFDNLKEMNTWKNYEYLLGNYHFLVVRRGEEEIGDWIIPYQKRIIFCDIPVSFLSSTYLREQRSKKKDVKEYLDSNVYQYIQENRFYEE